MGLEFVMKAPTRVSSDLSTCLDHFVFQNCNQMKCDVVEHHSFTDHYLVLFLFLSTVCTFVFKALSEKYRFVIRLSSKT